MSPEEKISLLEIDIKKIELDLAKLNSFLIKMENIKNEEIIKMMTFETNMDFLRSKPVIVSLSESHIILSNIKKIKNDILEMDKEIVKLKHAQLAHKQIYDNMIKEKEKLTCEGRKGILLQFKRK